MNKIKQNCQLITPAIALLISLIALTNCVPITLSDKAYDEIEPPHTDVVSKTPKEIIPESSPSMTKILATPTQQEEAYSNIRILRGINIGNALEAPNPGEWGVTIRKEYFQIIREAGFNAVRIPVRFSEHTGLGPTYPVNETFFELVDDVINWGLECGLTVILDFHHFPELMEDPINEKDRFLAIWDQISERYQDMPSNLFFELLNEPHQNLNAELWNDLIEASIGLIRKKNPSRKILVCGVNFSDIDSLFDLSLPEDDNLIATFHFYEPFKFTHQGAAWASGSSAWLGTTWQATQSEMQEISWAFDLAVNWSNSNQTPLVIGEFGVINKADLASRTAWINFIIHEAERREMSWFYWVFCSDFGIYDCQNKMWDEDIINCLLPE